MAKKLNKDQIFKAADKYIRDGKVEKAITEYEKWLTANPKDWNTIRQIGDLYHRIGRNAEAIKKYSQIAEYYKTDGFNVRAIATYKMILRLDPQNEPAMAGLADLQVAQGLLMEAKSQYQTLVEVYNKSGQKKRAAEVFKKLAEIDPSDLKVRYKYAEFLDRQGQTEEAITEYIGIADEFINNGLVPEAIQIMEKGLRIDSANRSLRCKLAQASVLQGDYGKAIQILREIQSRYPNDIELLTRLGEAYMAAGSADEAETLFSRLAELEPDNPDHVSRRAEVAIGQGRLDQALDFLNPVVNRHVDSGDGDKATALLQKVLGRDPHHVKTLVKLSEIHTILRNEQARISAYDQLCEAYSHHGDYEKAVRVAEQLIELEPESSQHKDRLRFLKSRLAPAGEAGVPPAHAAAPAPDMDVDIPGLESVEGADELLETGFESDEPELSLEEPPRPAVAAPITDGLEAATTFTEEDEEHIKEKLTEAEVFVRYGLVDKAIDQLKDVLESFRFHTESREKLIEVYKDQGMNREAGEQMVELARVYERRGESETAERLLHEAREMNPALARAEEEAGVATEEELELTLTPEDDLEAAGLETDFIVEQEAPGFDEEVPGAEPEAFAPEAMELEEELPVAVEEESLPEPSPSKLEPAAIGPEEEVELTLEEPQELPVLGEGEPQVPSRVDMGPAAHEEIPEIGVEEDIPVIDEDEDELAEVGDLAFDSEVPELLEEMPVDTGVDDGHEIDLQLPTTERPAAEQELLHDEADAAVGDFHVDLDEEVESLGDEAEVEEISVEIPDMGQEMLDSQEPAVEMDVPDIPLPEAAPEVAAPAESATASPVSAELNEVDEYIALGLYEDARDTLRELLKRNPGDRAVLAKIEELGFSTEKLQKEAAVADVVATTGPLAGIPPTDNAPDEIQMAMQNEPLASIEGFGEPEVVGPHRSKGGPEPFVDLASELSQEMFGTQSAVEEEVVEESAEALSDPGLDEIFREFKKGVEKQLGTEDYDTRYNLGIAYKEMGLLDEAIAEFQLAAKDHARLLECCSMLGLCFMEKGMPDIAIKWFEKGLDAPGRSEEEYHGLRYDLAQAHEAAGDTERALGLYMDIYRVNARFRDVRERVRELQAAKN